MLNNKNILFIAPNFFGYEDQISQEIIRRGANLDFIPDRPFNSVFLKAITRLKREWVIPFLENYYLSTIKSFSRNEYDYIFVLGGEALSEKLLIKIKEEFSNAIFILYMWDSFENRVSLKKNIRLFDKCFTFDRSDAEQFNLTYRPLFFGEGFKVIPNQQSRFDISFVGTAHSDRYSIITKIISMLPDSLSFYHYFFLQAPWVFYIKKIFTSALNGSKKKDFNFSPLSKKEVEKVFQESFAIFDVEHPLQRGLTIRSIEALGAGKKLVTTNESITKEDFYNSQNIHVLDRGNLEQIPSDFFNIPFQPVSQDIYYKYSISGWIDDIFNES